jgi:hypothetical protein
MARLILIFFALALSACNLTNDAPTGPTPSPALPTAAPDEPGPLPTSPVSLPTRTPVGFSGPATPMMLDPALITPLPGGSVPVPAPAGGSAALGSATSPTGSITSPADNAAIASGMIQLSGTAGGIPENQFVLALIGADGTVVSSIIITLTNPTYTNIVTWTAVVGTGGYRGLAEIRAFTLASPGGGPSIFASVRVTVQ